MQCNVKAHSLYSALTEVDARSYPDRQTSERRSGYSSLDLRQS